jgi:hypothetical protein
METIVLKPLYHHDKECTGIYFERNADLLSKNNYQQLSRILEGKGRVAK